MWKKPIIEEIVYDESEFDTINDNELKQIEGGKGVGWYGGCIAAGSTCNMNDGGFSVGVCVMLGVTYRTSHCYRT